MPLLRGGGLRHPARTDFPSWMPEFQNTIWPSSFSYPYSSQPTMYKHTAFGTQTSRRVELFDQSSFLFLHRICVWQELGIVLGNAIGFAWEIAGDLRWFCEDVCWGTLGSVNHYQRYCWQTTAHIQCHCAADDSIHRYRKIEINDHRSKGSGRSLPGDRKIERQSSFRSS